MLRKFAWSLIFATHVTFSSRSRQNKRLGDRTATRKIPISNSDSMWGAKEGLVISWANRCNNDAKEREVQNNLTLHLGGISYPVSNQAVMFSRYCWKEKLADDWASMTGLWTWLVLVKDWLVKKKIKCYGHKTQLTVIFFLLEQHYPMKHKLTL